MAKAKEAKFVLGDIVKLKSGGPDMTVNEVSKDAYGELNGKYRCQWFAGKKLDVGTFPVESLEPGEPGKK